MGEGINIGSMVLVHTSCASFADDKIRVIQRPSGVINSWVFKNDRSGSIIEVPRELAVVIKAGDKGVI